MKVLERMDPDDIGAMIADAESGLGMVRQERLRQQVRTGWRVAAEGLAHWVTHAAAREKRALLIPAEDVATLLLSAVHGLARMRTLCGLAITRAGLEVLMIGIVRSGFGP